MSELTIGSLCTGYGGLDMAVEAVLDARTAWVSDIDKGACKVLEHRFPDIPNLGDMTAIDWSAVEPVDVITAGYPCQPFSHAGNRKGTDDARHLWPIVREAIRHLRPRLALLENVAGHRSLGFDRVLGDLAEDGMHVVWVSVRASDAGAPHRRERLFIAVTPADARRLPREVPAGRGLSAVPQPASDGDSRGTLLPSPRTNARWGEYAPAIGRWEYVLEREAPEPTETGPKGNPRLSPAFTEWMMGLPAGWITDVPGVTRNEALKLCGNGVVPQQAEAALRYLLPLIGQVAA